MLVHVEVEEVEQHCDLDVQAQLQSMIRLISSGVAKGNLLKCTGNQNQVHGWV